MGIVLVVQQGSPNEHPRETRWDAHPYRVLSGKLNFGKMGKSKEAI
jgi:hypothetical protein